MTRLPRSGALAVAEKKELDRRRSPVIQRGWCFRNGIAGAATFVEILLVRTDVIERWRLLALGLTSARFASRCASTFHLEQNNYCVPASLQCRSQALTIDN